MVYSEQQGHLLMLLKMFTFVSPFAASLITIVKTGHFVTFPMGLFKNLNLTSSQLMLMSLHLPFVATSTTRACNYPYSCKGFCLSGCTAGPPSVSSSARPPLKTLLSHSAYTIIPVRRSSGLQCPDGDFDRWLLF